MNPIHKERIRLASIEREKKKRDARALTLKSSATRNVSDQKLSDDIILEAVAQPVDQKAGVLTSPPSISPTQLIEKLRIYLRANCTLKEALAMLRVSQEELDTALAAISIDLKALTEQERLAGRAALKVARQREAERGNARFLELTADSNSWSPEKESVWRAHQALLSLSDADLAKRKAELAAVINESREERTKRMLALSAGAKVLTPEEAATPVPEPPSEIKPLPATTPIPLPEVSDQVYLDFDRA